MRLSRYLLLFVLTISLTSCDSSSSSDNDNDNDNGSSSITIQDLVGSWEATSHVFTNASDSNQSIDTIGLGEELDITILANGGVRTWHTLGDFSDEWDAMISISGSTLKTTPVETTRASGEFTIIVNGNTFTLTDNSSEFDFTLSDGAPVAAREVITFGRK